MGRYMLVVTIVCFSFFLFLSLCSPLEIPRVSVNHSFGDSLYVNFLIWINVAAPAADGWDAAAPPPTAAPVDGVPAIVPTGWE